MGEQNFCAICLLTKLLGDDIIEILLGAPNTEQLKILRQIAQKKKGVTKITPF